MPTGERNVQMIFRERRGTAALLAAVVARLIGTRDSAGGWGWHAGHPGNTECTALAVMALHAHRAAALQASAAMDGGLQWLRRRQHANGSWPLGEQVPTSSWMTGTAVLALARLEAERTAAVRGAEWLLGRESAGLSWLQRLALRFSGAERAVDQDPILKGWPWTDGAAAWVEPTAWSLLAIKAVVRHLPGRRAAQRIDQAERLLEDRMCFGGGWNYGNKRILGEELDPYPDTTALALMALQDRRSAAVTGVSVDRLNRMIEGNRTLLVLALAVLALQLHGEDVAPLRAELAARTRVLDPAVEVRTLALTLLALDDSTIHFQVSRHA